LGVRAAWQAGQIRDMVGVPANPIPIPKIIPAPFPPTALEILLAVGTAFAVIRA
jgi:hypothetical protein